VKGSPKEYNKLSVNPILCPLETNVIYCGDCLKQLEKIPSESIDLIYIAPPFSSNRNYVVLARARAGQTDDIRVCVRQIG
jgi:hypothetical protein